MTILLEGCRTEPLGSYLQGLGVWRAVVRLLDPGVRGSWAAGRLLLTLSGDTDFGDIDDLAELLYSRFEPLPVVSPWNAGSGFAGNGRNVSAERALAAVRSSTEPRFDRLRRAVAVADRVVAMGREMGWEGSGDDLWDKAHKADVMQLCRNELPDDALPWIDAAVVLGRDERGGPAPTYSRLLGTGGNFGRQDLSSTYLQSVLTVFADKRSSEKRPSEKRSSEKRLSDKRSRQWLRAVLSGDESTPYERGPVGQFDPGRAGGVQSSPSASDVEGFANPWAFIFAIEGAVLFASAAVRREGALTSRVAVPFTVRASTVGFVGDADGETVHAEIWMPEWDRPASLPEVERLLGEGRAEWGGKPARNGLDFVRAVASLGVDRGITHFTRHVVAERLGQNPLAVPVGRVAVPERVGAVGLLAQIDPWLERVRASAPPGEIAERLRRLEATLFQVGSGGASPEAMREVIVALGRLHQAVSRSSTARAKVWPLTIRNGAGWWRAVHPDTPELRIAGALASASDAGPGQRPAYLPGSLRLLVTPVELARGGGLVWADRPAYVPMAGNTLGMLADAHRRRAVAGAVTDAVTGAVAGAVTDPHAEGAPVAAPVALVQPAVKGVLSAYRRGLTVPLEDVVALATGDLDAELLGDYLSGLLLLDWDSFPSTVDNQPVRRPSVRRPLIPGSLALLLPFFAVRPLPVRLCADDRLGSADDGLDSQVVLRPGAGWLTGLRSTNPSWVFEDAVRRLRAAGIARTIIVRPSSIEGDATAAALLLRVSLGDRLKALHNAAALPSSVPHKGDAE